MAGNRKRRKIKESEITGLKYFDQLAPLLARLHEEGCQRDRAGNRQLHFDQYCMLVLLYLFNPVVPNGGGEHDERAVLETVIESDRLYVADRGYAKFSLFNKIVSAGSSYVCRLRDNSVWEIVEEKYRNDQAALDEIISDEIVCFYFIGLASEDELMTHIEKLKPHSA